MAVNGSKQRVIQILNEVSYRNVKLNRSYHLRSQVLTIQVHCITLYSGLFKSCVKKDLKPYISLFICSVTDLCVWSQHQILILWSLSKILRN